MLMMCIFIFKTSIIGYCKESNDHFSFYIFIKEVKLETSRTNIRIQSWIQGNSSSTNIKCFIKNDWIINEINKTLHGGSESYWLNEKHSWTWNNVTYRSYNNTSDFSFDLFGTKALYPYDSYMLNFTIRVFNFNLAYQDNTEISIHVWPIEWSQRTINPEFIVNNREGYSDIIFQIIIDRVTWEKTFFEIYYIVLFTIVALMYLLDVKKHINKIIIYVSLFIASSNVLIFFSDYIPAKSGPTFITYLFLSLIASILVFLSSDVFELYVSKYNIKIIKLRKSILTLYPFSNLASSLIIYLIWHLYKTAYKYYYWIKYPKYYEWIIISIFLIMILIDVLFNYYVESIKYKQIKYFEY